MRVSGPMFKLIAALSILLDMKIQATPGLLSPVLLRQQTLDLESTICALIRSFVLEKVRPTTSLLKQKVVSPLRTVINLWIKMVLHLLRFAEPT